MGNPGSIKPRQEEGTRPWMTRRLHWASPDASGCAIGQMGMGEYATSMNHPTRAALEGNKQTEGRREIRATLQCDGLVLVSPFWRGWIFFFFLFSCSVTLRRHELHEYYMARARSRSWHWQADPCLGICASISDVNAVHSNPLRRRTTSKTASFRSRAARNPRTDKQNPDKEKTQQTPKPKQNTPTLTGTVLRAILQAFAPEHRGNHERTSDI